MQTILSRGMGVESTTMLVRRLEDASVKPCPLHELIVIAGQTATIARTIKIWLLAGDA